MRPLSPLLVLLALLTLRTVAFAGPPEGLRFTAVASGVGSVGGQVVFTLRFSNESKQPVRIYLVRSEPFRALQSMLRVARASDGTFVDLQPPPRPHGYVVDESDFQLIPVGRSFTTTQSLELDPAIFQAGEKYAVTWIYTNDIRKWPGGIVTVDGPTKPLFGGKEIPYIWTGRSDVDVEIRVRR